MIPTRDHKLIRWWANKHNAVPVEMYRRKKDGEPTALHLIIGGPGEGTPDLKPITWDDFFARFDVLGLSLAFDEASSDFELRHAQRELAGH